jgi:hypothetical protein
MCISCSKDAHELIIFCSLYRVFYQYEAVPESLKNCLLVMSTSDTFTEVTANQPGSLWNVTWTRINKFLPNLKAEIFPAQASSEGGSSYAALMMGVGKTLFSTELPKSAAVLTSEPTFPPSTTMSPEIPIAGAPHDGIITGQASDLIQGVETVMSLGHNGPNTTEAENESSLL